MATLVLGAAGAAIGSALLPAGFSVFGATIGGAAIGRAVGALAGSFIDNALFGASGQQGHPQEGARLDDLHVTASTEGASIPRTYGRVRLGGQMIWATDLEEVKIKHQQSSGKGLGGPSVTTTEYKYYGNFAIAICEGPISRIGRVWAGGDELDLSKHTYRIYTGSEDQMPDSLIEAKEGAGNAPAYRGLAYIVFEGMDLEDFGNRVPQFSFEVFRPPQGGVNDAIKAMTIIPAATEFGYEPAQNVVRDDGSGFVVNILPVNIWTQFGRPDFAVAMDDMQATLPNVARANLFAAWFGDDLRCGSCQIKPRVERNDTVTWPISWEVAGLARGAAQTVSTFDGVPAYGGTPSDSTVRDAIVDLQDRGLNVALTAFLLMDIASSNGLPDPWGGAEQGAYPWRGRITCDPAPGQPGTADQTAAAATQIDAFYGTVTASDFSVSGGIVSYSGPSEWSYSRFILHYAALGLAAEQLSGTPVESFVIGSEMRSLTWVRDETGAFPFVAKLKSLAAEVKALLPNTKITYAADWSEFTPYQTAQFGGPSGEIFFHLDDLWIDGNIDAIGIDNYWPLADWRDGTTHTDYLAGYRSIYDTAYLQANIEGGEGYDWYYASQADRDAQTRTTITDSYGKPWVFRSKDIRNWWANSHYNRPGGVEDTSPTAWTPENKPIWFMELGCPGVDKGANQPNVFYDVKSSESAFPYYSLGVRDDTMQDAYLRAMINWFDPASETFGNANPISSVYGERMVDSAHICVYTWDARPYPAFPNNVSTWSDGPNWHYGHWLNGRLGNAPLKQTLEAIFADYGFSDYEIGPVSGTMAGCAITDIQSARASLQPLETIFFLDSFESDGKIKIAGREYAGEMMSVAQDDLVDDGGDQPGTLFQSVRAQESELPGRAKISYFGDEDYQAETVEAIKLSGQSSDTASANLPIVAGRSNMLARAEQLLHEQWAARERYQFSLPPSRLAVEPGDVLTLTIPSVTGGADRIFRARVKSADLGGAIRVEALGYDRSIYGGFSATLVPGSEVSPKTYGPAVAAFMDIAMLSSSDTPHAGRIAAYAKPFAGVSVLRSPDTTGYALNTQLDVPAIMGETMFDLYSGPAGRFDYGNILYVHLYDSDDALESVSDLALFGGANLCAVETAPDSGQWELLQFADAVLTAPGEYRLSRLLRGQFGSEGEMGDPIAAGAKFVLLTSAVKQVSMEAGEIGLPFNWKYGPSPKPIDDFTWATTSFAFTGRGLKPFSPVQVRGEWDTPATGDVTISWVRRTRLDGDSWEMSEVPLGEDSESYEVDIMDGAAVKRTFSSASASVVYSEADQITDWGAVQASYTLQVYQLSATVGRGIARQAVISQ